MSHHLQELYLDNPSLWQLYFVGAPNVKSLDFSKCPNLAYAQIYNVGLDTLDFSACPNLYLLSISGLSVTELDLSSNLRLHSLQANDNPYLTVIWLKKGIIIADLDVAEGIEIKYK